MLIVVDVDGIEVVIEDMLIVLIIDVGKDIENISTNCPSRRIGISA